jgi:hypothetical protein
MADAEVGRSWRRWRTVVQWEPNSDPVLRTRLDAFLDRVLASIDRLAIGLTDATDVDAIAVLSRCLCDEVPPLPETVRSLHAGVMAITDTDVERRMATLAETLAVDGPSVRTASLSLLLERCCHATLASGGWGG